MNSKNQLIIYKTAEGPELEVKMQGETLWLTQAQIAKAFDVGVRTINEHIQNIYKTGELTEKATIRNFRIVQSEGKRSVERDVKHYNLDMVISIGYRVNSKKATQFRIWATNTLRQYLTQGYVLNQKRIGENFEKFEKAVHLIRGVIGRKELSGSEEAGLLRVITEYANTWLLLQKYDEGQLVKPKGKAAAFRLEYDFAKKAIIELKQNLVSKKEASDLFGSEREQMFAGILGNIYQTFDKKELYGSLEEKAACLLYFVIKDHSFSDGNKRIGSFLFIVFLARNNALYRKDGERKINDNALVALALLIAESNPQEKEVIISLVMNLLFEGKN